MKRTLLFVLLFCAAVMLRGTFAEDFEAGLNEVETDEQFLALIQSFVPQAQEIEDHRLLQNYWLNADREACLNYYDQLLDENPGDPKYQYLAIRMKDNALQMTSARQMIAGHPDFYWGYRIMAVNMIDPLRDEAAATAYSAGEYAADKQRLEQGLQKFPQDPFLKLAQFHSLWFDGDLKGAEGSLMEITAHEALQYRWKDVLAFLRETGRAELLEPLQRRLPVGWMRTGGYDLLSEEEQQAYDKQAASESFDKAYFENLGLMGETGRMESFLESHPEYQNDSELQLQLLAAYLGLDRTDAALDLIQSLVEARVLGYPDLKDNESLALLQDDQRWEGILAAAEQKWQADAPLRRQEALQGRLDKLSPDWELDDAEGNKVRAADLRGKVVVLDFWATWCGPCRLAMPVLDNWMKTAMPDGVEVFSVNVMEKDPQAARDYMLENDYAMTLLFGTDGVYRQYGGDGIPHIIVIDKQGKIAYEHLGFSEDLEFRLQAWTEALTAE